MTGRPEEATSALRDGDSVPGATIRVMRPQLPSALTLLPYLQRIDAARIYSNFGPLVLELEARLADRLKLPTGSAVTAATGTAGLVGAILASAGRATVEKPLALIPSFSFVATAVAAELCGFTPHLVDVDKKSWMLDPERLYGHPALDRVGAVIAVAPFGRELPQAPWLRFRERTGIPVVIDGAAAFESISAAPETCLGPIPVVLSLHATKSLAAGEGGCVATTDADLALRTMRALNFGFYKVRDSVGPSLNGKMSEYHAAVGLAELDGWESKRQAFASAAARYQRQAAAAGLAGRLITAPDICSSYALFECRDASECERLQEGLRSHDVEYRRWYGAGIDRQSHFADCPADPLPVTRRLASTLLGLPMATDFSDAMIAQVMRGLRAGLSLPDAAA